MNEIGTSNGGGDKQDPQTSDHLKQKGKLTEIETSSGGEELHETIHQLRSDAPDDQVPPHATIPIAGIETSNSRGERQPRRVMQKVPSLLLDEEKNREDYIPKAVSVGPYHHGKAELSLAEAFKPKAVEMFVYGGELSRDFYYTKVFERIGEIKSCYEEGSTDAYSDRKLAEMMLYDACNFKRVNFKRFLNGSILGEYDSRSRLRWERRREPFHLLEAFHMVVASSWNESEHQNELCLKCRQRWEQCRQCFKRRWLCYFRVERPLASAENAVIRSTVPDLQAGVDPAADADPSSENGVNRSTGPDLQAGVYPAADADPSSENGVNR
ncbi:UNVERIFIED_CONTAM: hypothetical protein Slati_0946700 [Sesamum latifolium]|uniref:Uncharacterized protein n=1 Tax=Sesamum latifolium TaxID=2727402 RepID=A0AAW2XWD0_9LAMI